MIEIRELQKIIGDRTALDVASLEVEDGQIVAVVGAAGSGLDALFDVLLGRTRPSGGTVLLGGTQPWDREGFSQRVGVLFAEDALYPHRSPLANLTLHCQLYGLPASRAREVLAWVGMADQAQGSVAQLPSGLARRIAFGRAVLHQPSILLLNDPFARCDDATIGLLSGLLRELADDGVAVLILAPDSAHLFSVCDAIYTLANGLLSGVQEPGAQEAALPFKIPVKGDDKVILVNPADILYVEAEGGRTCLHGAEGVLPTQFSLAELERRLARSGFFRAHRGYLVNLQHAAEIIPYTRNSYTLRLNDAEGTEIPLSKAAAAELRELLGY